MRTNLTADTYRRLFQQQFLWKKLWPFGLFSGDKGDYIDVMIIKNMIKTNQTDTNVCFFQKYNNHVCPQRPAFFSSVYWFVKFNPDRQNGTKNL